jgi:hypothetical protein
MYLQKHAPFVGPQAEVDAVGALASSHSAASPGPIGTSE